MTTKNKKKVFVVQMISSAGTQEELEFVQAATPEEAMLAFERDYLDKDDVYTDFEFLIHEVASTTKFKHVMPPTKPYWEKARVK